MALLEVLPTQSSDVISGAGISSRRIGSSNQSRAIWNQALNLVGVDAAMVVATGSGCCPSRDLPLCCVESQDVLGLDLSDITPAKSDSAKGIGNDNSFITDLEFGLMNNEIKEASQYRDSSKSKDNVQDIRRNEGLNNSASQESVSNVGNDHCGCGSEELNVGHRGLSILSGDNND